MKFFLGVILLCLGLLGNEINLLKNAEIYVDRDQEPFSTITSKRFEAIDTEHLNYGFNADISIWIRFTLNNNSALTQETIVEVNNPLLEHVTLYSDTKDVLKKGMLHIEPSQHSINPAFSITLKAHCKQIYYLHVKNTTTALQFSLKQIDVKSFYDSDKAKQFFVVLFIGIIGAFLIYSLALFFYTRDISYFYYIIYIATLVFQQLTYIGFLPLYMPQSFTAIDNISVVPKVGAMIITAALFARSFLKSSNFKEIDRIYKLFIIMVIAQIITLSTPYFYYPEVTIVTGLLFIFYNLYAGIYVYKKGNKQARFFITGWSFLVVGYFLSIIDALGLYSVMYHLPSLVLLCTIFEALFLLLAFVDKLSILQQEKERSEKKLFHELERRNELVEVEVEVRTKALKNLYRELHHRVKNNLQIMLSIIRLQGDKLDNETLKSSFLQLENRIRSIAKTHELLYQNDAVDTIDMDEYIESLCGDINTSLSDTILNFNFDIDVKMGLKEAVYVGLIINELVSNSIKHASECDTITITLHQQDGLYSLHVKDNGDGYTLMDTTYSSLGLKLVNILVHDQLNGTIETTHQGQSSYDIRFKV
jgi:two-component sensor histidine kinase